MSRPIAQDERGMSTLGAFAALLVILALMFVAYYAFFVPARTGPVLRIQQGDAASLDYTGYFEETGLVFDTSDESVAKDNASWPKAVSFHGMPAGGPWQPNLRPIEFDIGEGDRRAVPGFEQGLLGLAAGESRVLTIPFELAYGPMDPALLEAKPLQEPVPVHTTMSAAEFESTYGSPPFSGMNVTDPFWQWDAYASVAGTIVTVTNSPSVGDIVRPYGAWDAQVAAIDDAANEGEGIIWVSHRLAEADEHRVGGKHEGRAFYLSDVDSAAETYTLNFNREVVGRTLVFIVKIVSVSRT
jgi:FKBP-type peptidyl-prolyl cis-trans isomerase 2